MTMTFDTRTMPKVFQIYLEISQYPILARRIRQRMREELFARGIVSPQQFEREVRDKAMQSQQREGLDDPYFQEPLEIWNERLSIIRDSQTDFYFAYNLPHDLFIGIVQELVSQRIPDKQIFLGFNPELAPWELLFAQAEEYERYPPEKRSEVEHHLREIIVVLIKAMISDQLSFVRVARKYFTITDLTNIRNRRIGRGKIGGKAAGMWLAHKILDRNAQAGDYDARQIAIPESWYLGSDVYYEFHSRNDLFRFMNQKYKALHQMKADYPEIYNSYLNSDLPEYVVEELSQLLQAVEKSPLIVRSSSLLEDNFDTSFAGKYDSFFLPNQGTHEENLRELVRAIVKVYASVVRPEALIYREHMGLTDYDERMAVLIQKVEGQRHGRYFFPDIAGVGFSHNPYRWSSRIQGDAGLLRMVAGLGTRAVDRVGSDYPRMIALSHPELRPERAPELVRRYSQHMIDVIDMEENTFKTVPIRDVLSLRYPSLSAIMSLDKDGFIQPMVGRPLRVKADELVVTFDNLLSESNFVAAMRSILTVLEEAYGRSVDIEWAAEFVASHPKPRLRYSVLQCRTQSLRKAADAAEIPEVPEEDIVFTANRQVPSGTVTEIEYIVYVNPRTYAHIPEPQTRIELGNLVGRLNQALAGKTYILMGPGRWGSSNIQLGVRVNYADIFHTAVLIEIAYEEDGSVPEVSYGTHFFQDLVEANIYPLPLYPDDEETTYREDWLNNAPNALSSLLPADDRYEPYLKVIDVAAYAEGHKLSLVMNSEQNYAIAYLV
ncbi:MAG: phosphoenolpyruvate synthase [Chloroflexi bacterium]|nr:phosphoenolpyruvate synthase [Chloroflexota bacterium]